MTNDPDKNRIFRKLVDQYTAERLAGKTPDEAAMLAQCPEFADELKREFKRIELRFAASKKMSPDETDKSHSVTDPNRLQETQSAIGKPELLQISCPECCRAIKIEADTPWTDLTCGGCNAKFNLAGSDSATEQPLARVGHFELRERVGVGAFGTVWKARDINLDRTVAVKIPRKGQLDEVEVENFFREARAAAQLQHPNIVTVHEIGRSENSIFIVSDFVDGLSLLQWRKTYPPTVRTAAELCSRIAQAVQHAHEQGVIHRDLKPQNIMIDADGEPHIMDFGLAKRDAGEITMTMDGAVLGTPAYMSPEQARGKAHDADARSDVYSIGVILFELLTAELPFRGNTQTLIHQILFEEVPSPRKLNPGVPNDLETICLKCLEKDRNRRYESAKSLGEDLDRYLNEKAIAARPPSTIYQIRKWANKNRRLVAMTIAMVALLMVVVFGSLWFRSRGSSKPEKTAEMILPGETMLAVAVFTHFNYVEGTHASLFQNGSVHEGDDLRIVVEFDAPVYCFLFAANPDGVIQLCYPEDAWDLVQKNPIQQFGYLEDNKQGFPLTDGAGQQAFIIVESSKPLPSFRAWSANIEMLAQKAIAQTHGRWIWKDDGVHLGGEATRGTPRDLKGAQEFEKLFRSMQSANPDVTLHGITFPVRPDDN